jgi:membrane-associated HD superfamily phosphohydrolase
MSSDKKKMTRGELALQIIIFSLGFFYATVYYIAVPTINLQAISDNLLAYLTAVLTAAFAIGVINITRVHVINIKRRRATWKYSVLLLICLCAMAIFSVIASPFALDPDAAVIPASVIAFATPIWEFLYYKILVNVNSSIFSLLAFFIASAAYRAFKARTFESTILLVAGLLVILGQAPIAGLIWPGFSAIREWILAFPNTAGQRGMLIGIALGVLVFTVRRLFRYPWGG